MTAEDLKKLQAFKDQYAAAAGKKDKAAMEAAHAGAEALRANYGFSGGPDGSRKIGLSIKANPEPTTRPGLDPVVGVQRALSFQQEAPLPQLQQETLAQVIPKPQAPVDIQMPNMPTATDNTANIQAMYDNITKSQSANLNAARDQANSDYQAQIDATPAQFQPKRDEVDVNTVRQIQALNESAAAKGQTFTGGVQSDQGGIGASGAAQKTALNQQELNVVNSLKKAIADNNRATDLKGLEMAAQNQAQAQQALIGERNRLDQANYQRAADQFNQGLNLAGLTGYYGGQRTMQGQQMDTQNAQWQAQYDREGRQINNQNAQWQAQYDREGRQINNQNQQWQAQYDREGNQINTQNQQWQAQYDREGNQINTQNQQWQAQFDREGNQINTQNQQWQSQFDREGEQWNKQFTESQKQNAIQNEQWRKNFDFQKDRAKVQDGQWLQAFQADQKNAAAGRAIQWGGLQLDRAKFEQAKKEALGASGDTSKEYQGALKNAFDMMSMTKKGVDAEGNPVDIQMYSQDDVGRYVANNPYMSPQQKEAMLRQLGFKP